MPQEDDILPNVNDAQNLPHSRALIDQAGYGREGIADHGTYSEETGLTWESDRLRAESIASKRRKPNSGIIPL